MTRFVERENKLSSPISQRAEQAADNEVKIIQGAYRIDMDRKITKMYSTRIQIKDIREQIKSRLKCPSGRRNVKIAENRVMIGVGSP